MIFWPFAPVLVGPIPVENLFPSWLPRHWSLLPSPATTLSSSANSSQPSCSVVFSSACRLLCDFELKRENGFLFGFILLKPFRNSLGNPKDLRLGAENHRAHYHSLVTLGAAISACIYLAGRLCLVISKTSLIFASSMARFLPVARAGDLTHVSCLMASCQLCFRP